MRCHFQLKDEDEVIAEVRRLSDEVMVDVIARLRREGQLELGIRKTEVDDFLPHRDGR